ncbi:uncharacterized protein LOC130732246 [Lotus japonicus]|uniref:uncharacterized protein LOC130732246 n=1 Tax=Lotus japonicus TaxID=34305 RepID=UPI00258BF160|nr:uncharacterized protein LOC130732246 [Lotus japonicus]
MAAAPSPRKTYSYMAKLAWEAWRYEEMVEFMEEVSAAADSEELELTADKRKLLFDAHGNVIQARCDSLRIISSMEKDEESGGNEDHVAIIRDYLSRIESELSNICEGISKHLDLRLNHPASSAKGEIETCVAELKIDDQRKNTTLTDIAPSPPRKKYMYMAKLAQNARRYDDIVEFMEKVIDAAGSEELTFLERRLLSVAYEKVMTQKRYALTVVSCKDEGDEEESGGNEDRVAVIRDYRSKIENEISNFCDGILELLDSCLILYASSGEVKAFYIKMKGDFRKYLDDVKARA